MKPYLIAFGVSLISVFFKALQNRNYNYNDYWLIIPTSWAIAGCELYLLSMYIREINVGFVLVVGTGSGIGGVIAMQVHERFMRRKP